jgi:Protein of unknown function DUF262
MKTAPTNKKVRELIQSVREGKLIPRPEFQRRLVWSRNDKNHFLDTILRGYPFPEIYVADGEVNLETGEGTQLLVDGLQRVSTIIQYFEAHSDLKLTTVPPYRDLIENEKKAFLQYDVAVRDLGNVGRDEIIEVFKRLNATKYSLLDIEVNNAVYTGAFKQYAEKLAGNPFFESHSVFNALDLKRMGDLRFAITIVITLISGYFNRDDEFGLLLERYNDDFPLENEINVRIQRTLDFIEECGFSPKCRVWRKADLFTLIIELDQALSIQGLELQPSVVVESLENFYSKIDTNIVDPSGVSAIYYKSALQASNDRINRVRRGVVILGILKQFPERDIRSELVGQGLFHETESDLLSGISEAS